MTSRYVVLGAGPAGMAAADELAAAERRPLLIEKEAAPGGLCRTIERNGFLFDIGGHRFLTRYDEINRLWKDVMGDDLLRVRRTSRVLYRQRFFRYPLSAMNAFAKLGAVESMACMASFLRYHLAPTADESFEGVVSNRFGRRLFDIFFKSYTEKVWGIPCNRLSADWAEQRIQGLSLPVALKRAILGDDGRGPKTLTDEFLYPKTGPGEFYRRFERRIVSRGTDMQRSSVVTEVVHDGHRALSVKMKNLASGEETVIPVQAVFSSIPLPQFVSLLSPAAPAAVTAAAGRLRFRNYLVVNVVLDRESLFPDQWIYIQSPEVRLARVQNYKNWSAAMVPNPRQTSLGLEYFASPGDSFWDSEDSEVIAAALSDLEKTGLGSRADVRDAFVVRQANAYPLYELGYRENLAVIRDYLSGLENFHPMGRAGLFRYCNSDLALLTGFYAARNALGERHNLWTPE